MQEALVAAHTTWPRDGIPDHPRAWLVTAATRRLVDEQRSAAARRRREQDWAAAQPEGAEVVQQDDSLTVLLMCCHPALSPASAVALTLRAVGGLTTAEIATAYLVPEPTMAQRISRAKRTLHDVGSDVRAARERRARATGCSAPSRWSTCSTTRGTPRAPVPTSPAPTARRRRSGWGGWCTGCCPTTRRPRHCSR